MVSRTVGRGRKEKKYIDIDNREYNRDGDEESKFYL
jgi:hypothetical protein